MTKLETEDRQVHRLFEGAREPLGQRAVACVGCHVVILIGGAAQSSRRAVDMLAGEWLAMRSDGVVLP